MPITPNVNPIFPFQGAVNNFASLTTANTALDGTGTVSPVFVAGANGGMLNEIRLKYLGANNATSVLRVFLNNGATNATAANNALIFEMTIPAVTALSQTQGQDVNDLLVWRPPFLILPPTYIINVCVGSIPAGGAGYVVTAFAGQY
jgi:hypothetical protein